MTYACHRLWSVICALHMGEYNSRRDVSVCSLATQLLHYDKNEISHVHRASFNVLNGLNLLRPRCRSQVGNLLHHFAHSNFKEVTYKSSAHASPCKNFTFSSKLKLSCSGANRPWFRSIADRTCLLTSSATICSQHLQRRMHAQAPKIASGKDWHNSITIASQ